MLNFLTWVLLGAALGWLGSRRTPGETAAGIMLNVAAGVVGAYLAGLLSAPLFADRAPEAAGLNVAALMAALAGGLLLVGLVNRTRRARPGAPAVRQGPDEAEDGPA
jgi:uncharacterized membrane protein YeaQ/YmgE (transglycosylase-associated protein family)